MLTEIEGTKGNQPIPVFYDIAYLTAAPPTNATVGTSSVLIVPANPNRKGLVLTNLSNFNVFLGFDTDALLNKGGVLGIFNMSERNATTGAIYAIAESAGCIIAIQEWSA